MFHPHLVTPGIQLFHFPASNKSLSHFSTKIKPAVVLGHPTVGGKSDVTV